MAAAAVVPERVRRVVAAPRDREEEGRRQVASAWGGIGDWGWQEVQLPGSGGRAGEGGGGGRGRRRDLGRSSVPSARPRAWREEWCAAPRGGGAGARMAGLTTVQRRNNREGDGRSQLAAKRSPRTTRRMCFFILRRRMPALHSCMPFFKMNSGARDAAQTGHKRQATTVCLAPLGALCISDSSA